MDMDNIDRKILTILQQNARTPLKVIAEQVFLSSPAVSARIERLEAAGYILGYQAQLSCAAMGYQIWRLSRARSRSFIPILRAVRT